MCLPRSHFHSHCSFARRVLCHVCPCSQKCPWNVPSCVSGAALSSPLYCFFSCPMLSHLLWPMSCLLVCLLPCPACCALSSCTMSSVMQTFLPSAPPKTVLEVCRTCPRRVPACMGNPVFLNALPSRNPAKTPRVRPASAPTPHSRMCVNKPTNVYNN